VPSRFAFDDIEHIVSTAIGDCEAGHNTYIEGRTVPTSLRGNARGRLINTVAVFALVIDSDADKGMGWTPAATIHPSMTVETSPGNFQFWFSLKAAVTAELAQKLGERIRHAVNSDHDTGNPTQPYRIAGTINYPNANKIARGRITVWTRLVALDPMMLWTPEDIERAFPAPEQPKTNGSACRALLS
jgi:RepB DNA-primase from phage plasmid